jgi:hypothetical protein
MTDNIPAGSVAKDSNPIASLVQKVIDPILRLVKKCRVNLNVEPTDPPYTAYMNGAGILPSGDICAIKAKAKQGKTQAATVLMSGLLGSERLGIRAAAGRKPKVVYFDTEQAEANTVIVGHRVHQLVGWEPKGNHPEFRCYNIRTESIEEKWAVIENVIARLEPTCVIIDGVADLVTDINDYKASSDCILRLMQLAKSYHAVIGCVLHENPGDEKMRGHIGTILLNKASEVFEVTNRDGTYRLNHAGDVRNTPAGYIEWRIDQGVLVRSDKPKEQITKEMREENVKVWRKVFVEVDEVTAGYNELKRAYIKTYKVAEKTARRHIDKAADSGYLIKTFDGKYALNNNEK